MELVATSQTAYAAGNGLVTSLPTTGQQSH
jgi:hypothetical protein